ncbi:MAG: GNAT family N-acetyltransferase [Flavobacteriaceae bacterium]|nr:GNAT family N-acetyltransferase [Flavobacteriaceae bacterium]
MAITNNPFTSSIYKELWQKFFIKSEPVKAFLAIKGVYFQLSKIGIYINIGTVKTLGVDYQINQTDNLKDIGSKSLIIYDVPDYIEIENRHPNLGLKISKQYEGFRINSSAYSNFEDYLFRTLSNRRRKKYLKAKRNMEREHQIRYQTYFGNIERATYENLFERLFVFMKKQYEAKREQNYHTAPLHKEWYKELFFALFQEKQASFHVIYNQDSAIAVAVNYHAENMLLAPFGSYDLAYIKYGIGNIQRMQKLEWVFENKKAIYYDLGKESYGYKQRWCNEVYHYNYHVLYNRKSAWSTIKALGIHSFFVLKAIGRKAYYRYKKITPRSIVLRIRLLFPGKMLSQSLKTKNS